MFRIFYSEKNSSDTDGCIAAILQVAGSRMWAKEFQMKILPLAS